jgi:hypothetical protein
LEKHVANVFLKIQTKFTVIDLVSDDPDEKQESVVALFKENTPTSFELTLMGPENQQVSFKPGQDSLVSGTLVMRPVGDAIEVEVDAVFKIAARSQFVDLVLDPSHKWYFDRITDVYGSPVGLTEEKYKYKNRFSEGEAVRHLMPVQTASTAKALK